MAFVLVYKWWLSLLYDSVTSLDSRETSDEFESVCESASTAYLSDSKLLIITGAATDDLGSAWKLNYWRWPVGIDESALNNLSETITDDGVKCFISRVSFLFVFALSDIGIPATDEADFTLISMTSRMCQWIRSSFWRISETTRQVSARGVGDWRTWRNWMWPGELAIEKAKIGSVSRCIREILFFRVIGENVSEVALNDIRDIAWFVVCVTYCCTISFSINLIGTSIIILSSLPLQFLHF